MDLNLPPSLRLRFITQMPSGPNPPLPSCRSVAVQRFLTSDGFTSFDAAAGAK
jgi:hypothetical protein